MMAAAGPAPQTDTPENAGPSVHSQSQAAIRRLRIAKQAGLVSRGEIDRAEDTVRAHSPDAGVPASTDLKTPRQPLAEGVVRTYAFFTATSGFLSLGFLDPFVVPGLQLKMLQDLCSLYEVPFTEEWGKELIGALVGSTLAKSLATRIVPVIGVFAGPATSAAATWALGRVFVQHFEAGGTLLKFSPPKMKQYFGDYFQSAPPLVAS